MKKNLKKYGFFLAIFIVGIYTGTFFSPAKENKTAAQKSVPTKWTCSMHPQINKPNAGDCPICGMDLIPAGEASEATQPDAFEMTPTAVALANIEVFKTSLQRLKENSVELLGRVVANKDKAAMQTVHFKGRLEKFYIKYKGQSVKKGQLIATIYAPDILVAQRELLTVLPFKESNPEMYNAVREKLKLWKLTNATIDAIEQSKKVSAYFPVYADFSGTVLEIMVQQGAYVKQGAGLFKIVSLNTVWGDFDAYESQAGLFKVGDLLAVKNLNGVSEKVKIAFIEPILDSKKRTFQVRVLLKNRKGLFKLGMFLKATAQKTSHEKSITIPKSAVLWTGKRSIVYVKNSEKNIFQMREVLLAPDTFENFYVVKDGLETGEYVVYQGVFSLDAAAQLLGKKSMMNASLGAHSKNIAFSSGFKTNFLKLLEGYFVLKDFFVKTDSGGILKQNKLLLERLNSFDKYQRKESEHWAVLFKNAGKIQKSQNIENQRILFKNISNTMAALLNIIPAGYPVFLQYCPMADGDKGGYWLSKEKNIKNPYFGEQMLTCGEVKKVINH